MEISFLWIAFAVLAITEGYYYRPPELAAATTALEEFDLDSFSDPYQRLNTGFEVSHHHHHDETGWYDEFGNYWPHFDPKPTNIRYQTTPKSVINYVPVEPGSGIVPNVFVEGRGYRTDRYVAPATLKKYLAMNPR